MRLVGSGYYVAVIGYQTFSPLTGGYISEMLHLIKPTSYETTEMTFYSNSRYAEKIAYLDAMNYMEIYVTFNSAGNKVIQTFGVEDTYIDLYDTSGNLLDFDDDSGHSLNALLSFNTTANTQYVIRIGFYDADVWGEVKLAILPSQEIAVDEYEDIVQITQTMSLGRTLQRNQVAFIRCKFSTTGNVGFTVESVDCEDTYVYVIDPRSTEPILENYDTEAEYPCQYSDDYFDYYAHLDKTMEANVDYLVIFCFFSAETEGDLSITIS